MNLHKLINPWIKVNFNDVAVLNLENNSRNVTKGTLFFAYPGAVTDGRKYIDDAIANGASAVLYDPQDFIPKRAYVVPVIAIANLKDKIADIAARYYSDPMQDLQIIGVTGTNGKTTIAYQLAQAYEHLGSSVAYIGTIGQGRVGELEPLINTTPDGMCLQKLFNTYRSNKIKRVCMEVSSHALAEGRVHNIDFQQAIYSNLTRDHLDFHHNMQNYAAAKAKLFAVPALKNAIINIDDDYADVMLGVCPEKCIKTTYGIERQADFRAFACRYSLAGSEFKVKYKNHEVALSINGVGKFNIYNSLAILASLMFYDYKISDIIDIMRNLKPADGRMELVVQSPYVFVDYSHTPDALTNALNSLITLRGNNPGKIWVVFGCGGDRDVGKRSLMGMVADKLADHVVITSDNPRTEDPQKIIDDISQGVNNKNCFKIVDRKEAIAYAIKEARSNDTILIAGKGHEDYQIIGNTKLDFSDREVVLELCKI